MLTTLALLTLFAGNTPARVVDAAQVIDLSAFPLPAGDVKVHHRTVAGQHFEVKGDTVAVFNDVKARLLAAGWQELPGSQARPESATGNFRKQGFTLTVSAYVMGGDGKVTVTINNHGNIELKSLPVPPGCSTLYELPTVLSLIAPGTPEAMVEASDKLLKADGWIAYGDAIGSRYYRKNAVLLKVRIGSAPAQNNKTFIELACDQLSAELPAPPGAEQLQYHDENKDLRFSTTDSTDAVHAFYEKALGELGWKPTTERPVVDRNKHWRIYRNGAKELINIDVLAYKPKAQVAVKHQTLAEVEEADARAAAALKKKQAAQNRPAPEVEIKLPEGVREVKESKGRIEFKTGSGAAKAAVETLRANLKADGWTEGKSPVDQPQAGHYDLTKGEHRLTVSFMDPGIVVPGEVTITGIGLNLKVANKK